MPRRKKESKEASEAPLGFNAGTGTYLVPDYQDWAREHRIEQRGTDEGREGFPPANHGTPDRTHIEIQSYVTELATGCRGEVTQYWTRFRGYRTLWGGGIHDATNTSAVPA